VQKQQAARAKASRDGRQGDAPANLTIIKPFKINELTHEKY
jgi:hypothetical protein